MKTLKRIFAKQTPTPQCNYADNYYGDQVCIWVSQS